MDLLSNTTHYVFGRAPGAQFSYYMAALVIIGIMVLTGMGLKNYYTKKVRGGDYVYKKMFKKVSNNLVYFAIGFLFLVAVRYENIPYFAMRLWPILLGIGFLVYLGRQLYKYFKVYPKELSNFESRPKHSEKNAYLPNKR